MKRGNSDSHISFSFFHADMANTENITRRYYAGTKAVIFVYDITRLETLFEADSWTRDINLYLNDELKKGLTVQFVGNKLDKVKRNLEYLMELDDGEEDPQAEFVTQAQAKGYTDRAGFLPPLECSSKTGEGVEAVFNKIAKELAGQHEKKHHWCSVL